MSETKKPLWRRVRRARLVAVVASTVAAGLAYEVATLRGELRAARAEFCFCDGEDISPTVQFGGPLDLARIGIDTSGLEPVPDSTEETQAGDELPLEIYDIQDICAGGACLDLSSPDPETLIPRQMRAVVGPDRWPEDSFVELHQGILFVKHQPWAQERVRELIRGMRRSPAYLAHTIEFPSAVGWEQVRGRD
jgi:hypothetical protein